MTRPVAKFIALTLPLLTLVVAPLCALASEHPNINVQRGWTCLFNGKDLAGWHCVTSDNDPVEPDAWAVEDGAVTRKKKGYLRSDKQYGDFILDLQFKVGPPDKKGHRTNSGILFRHRPDPELKRQKKRYWHNGLLELQIFDSHDMEPDKHVCGALYDMIAPSCNPMKKPGEWNRITITADGPAITVILNGEKIIDCSLDDWPEANKNPDGTPNKYNKPMKDLAHKSGYIWLQDHPGEVWFRKIFVKSLD